MCVSICVNVCVCVFIASNVRQEDEDRNKLTDRKKLMQQKSNSPAHRQGSRACKLGVEALYAC